MLEFAPVTRSDLDELTDFLRVADLTVSGLRSSSVRLWVARDSGTGRVVASTGYEASADGNHVLIRSVAVDPTRRDEGLGLEAAQFALDRAQDAIAVRAWLFSRRSGPFWQKLGFAAADRHDLALALADTHQVRLFVETGQLERESAWSRTL